MIVSFGSPRSKVCALFQPHFIPVLLHEAKRDFESEKYRIRLLVEQWESSVSDT